MTIVSKTCSGLPLASGSALQSAGRGGQDDREMHKRATHACLINKLLNADTVLSHNMFACLL